MTIVMPLSTKTRRVSGLFEWCFKKWHPKCLSKPWVEADLHNVQTMSASPLAPRLDKHNSVVTAAAKALATAKAHVG